MGTTDWDPYARHSMRQVTYEHECGCFCSRLFHPDGELLELRLQVCEDCMNNFSNDIQLKLSSETAQLTIPLPSPRATGGETYHG